MSKLPVVSGDELVKILKKVGYEFDHQRGSHIIMRQVNSPYRRITVPRHKEIAKGTLRSIIREIGISVEEFTTLI